MDVNEDTEALLERWPMAAQFDLPERSLVLVVGAYQGLTMELLDELYHPASIIGFEPQAWACLRARERLQYRPNCRVLIYGLGPKNEYGASMGEYNTDAASFVNIGLGARDRGVGNIRRADAVLEKMTSGRIDLMVMNIEGMEFSLLPHLLDTGWVHMIDRLAVQFHQDLGNDENSGEIQMRIDEDHERVIDDYPTWVYWVKR